MARYIVPERNSVASADQTSMVLLDYSSLVTQPFLEPRYARFGSFIRSSQAEFQGIEKVEVSEKAVIKKLRPEHSGDQRQSDHVIQPDAHAKAVIARPRASPFEDLDPKLQTALLRISERELPCLPQNETHSIPRSSHVTSQH